MQKFIWIGANKRPIKLCRIFWRLNHKLSPFFSFPSIVVLVVFSLCFEVVLANKNSFSLYHNNFIARPAKLICRKILFSWLLFTVVAPNEWRVALAYVHNIVFCYHCCIVATLWIDLFIQLLKLCTVCRVHTKSTVIHCIRSNLASNKQSLR